MATATKGKPTAPARTRYEDDIYTWVQEQVALLRTGRLAEIDSAQIAEELEDVGKSEFGKLESAVSVLTQHLLKWDFQPERRSRSWTLSIIGQRKRIEHVLRDNPGLKSRIADAVTYGYETGRLRALDETGLPGKALPKTCPYSWDDIVSRPIAIDPDDA
jgi:Domain of unknown function DUF29